MSNMISARIVSSLEKALLTDAPERYTELREISVLKGERLNFQLLLWVPETSEPTAPRCLTVEICGVPCEVSCRAVRHVYTDFPTFYHDTTKNTPYYTDSESGLYPEILEPLDEGKYYWLCDGKLSSLWFECTPELAGEYELTVTVYEKEAVFSANTLKLTVVDAALPEQSLIFTQWFHCDCLASYYHVPILSEEHWRIIENYMRCAVRNGINCILTPIITPPLDTAVGTERPTVQLVKVYLKNGEYEFDFSLLDRWIDMAHACGVKYFEISHLFTQWGAEFAPKVVAETPEGQRRIFGWETPGTEGEYPRFLSFLLPALTGFLRKKGVLDACRFHVSDEPNADQLKGYKKAKEIIAPYLKGCVTVDALSSVEFYRQGILETPIPASNHIEDFLQEDIAERWTYYCCGQWNKVGNRFICYPSFRNRILGVQLYKFNIKGFLQWGYNFYYSMGSRRLLNPYVCQSGEGQVPCGDAFSVYPAPGGEPIESLRIAVFYEAIQDIEALKLCESVIGREAVVKLIDDLAGQPVTFSEYPASAEYILRLRREINRILAKDALKKA